MIITKCPHTNYDGTQGFLKFIQLTKDQFYINIYYISRISDLDKNV